MEPIRFLIITHVLHKKKEGSIYGYAPYVREMNLWLKHVDEVNIVAPLIKGSISDIDLPYKHDELNFTEVPQISFISILDALKSVFKIPTILITLFRACKKTDHIHLRCPGNIGFLGCLIQILFPKKIKTAKYAGNWDPESKQPLSYRLQKKILSSTFLTKSISVLVYGKWKNQTKNITPFFTATYHKKEVENIKRRDYLNKLNFVFVGSLVEGKRPLLVIKVIEQLKNNGKDVMLNVYGDGKLNKKMHDYIIENELQEIVKLHGNKKKETIKEALKMSHFLLLPSKSEGWPKAVAEAMFFGVIPIATKVSCVPFMLDYGNRGVLIEPSIDSAVTNILSYLKRDRDLNEMSELVAKWSQKFTLDYFESEIKKLVI